MDKKVLFEALNTELAKEKMTDREIIEKCRCYIHCIRKRVPDDDSLSKKD